LPPHQSSGTGANDASAKLRGLFCHDAIGLKKLFLVPIAHVAWDMPRASPFQVHAVFFCASGKLLEIGFIRARLKTGFQAGKLHSFGAMIFRPSDRSQWIQSQGIQAIIIDAYAKVTHIGSQKDPATGRRIANDGAFPTLTKTLSHENPRDFDPAGGGTI
jgi:hypothetical protein